MSTSGQQPPLTRRQLRELRETGSTPVITPEAEEAQSAPTPEPSPAAAEPAPATPEPAPAADTPDATGSAPLTRRQLRDLAARAAATQAPAAEPAPEHTAPPVAEPAPAWNPVPSSAFGPAASQEPEPFTPVSAAAPAFDVPSVREPVMQPTTVQTPIIEPETIHEPVDEQVTVTPTGTIQIIFDEAQDAAHVSATTSMDETPATVGSAFGAAVLQKGEVPNFAPSFDDLLSADSAGSGTAASALIFTPPAHHASLSGPVAATGELLVTGSYEVPGGFGSKGHADGTTDGKDVDAVLIDGELPAASSPTPIAASSAISTHKPAAEVIQPPKRDKADKLMITLAIVAGGLALVLAGALVFAYTTGMLG